MPTAKRATKTTIAPANQTVNPILHPESVDSSPATQSSEPVKRLSRDMAKLAGMLDIEQARFVVDLYYQLQDFRIAANNQVRTTDEADQPAALISYVAQSFTAIEGQIKNSLDRFTDSQELGQWCKSITGIGPVIAAGLMAHIDVKKAPTPGHIWMFAGIDPHMRKWEKGTLRPFNAKLKKLCWLLGESFVKTSGRETGLYGKVYKERKEWETRKNIAGDYTDQAVQKLKDFKIGKDTDAHAWYSGRINPVDVEAYYALPAESRMGFFKNRLHPVGTFHGMLPPAHIHARAKRRAVKIFLAHYHQVAFEIEYKTPAPNPYIIQHGGHTHFIAPPNWVPLKDRKPPKDGSSGRD